MGTSSRGWGLKVIYSSGVRTRRGWSALWLLLFVAATLNASETIPEKYRVCKNNRRSKFWAQLNVDADLMAQEYERLRIPLGHTKVAVIDTGFDEAGNRANMAVPHLTLLGTHQYSGQPNEDRDGHGTMVAGLIGAKGDIGIAPDVDLTVYRATGEFGTGITSKILSDAIARACDDGNTIINVSWGSVSDESGRERNEQAEKKTLEHLRAKGCLVVKSAGNSAYRAPHETDDLDDVYLRVAALNTSSTLSSFSSRGEVGAPGSFVFTLESTSRGYSKEDRSDRRCDDDDGLFTNGTSFSAPLTAAIAAKVRGLLVHLPDSPYSSMSPEKQVQVLTRIIKASEVYGIISGLRATLIAERWVDARDGVSDLTVKDLLHLLANAPPDFCSALLPEIFESVEALDEGRRYLAGCPTSDAIRGEHIVKTLNAALYVKNFELALRWLAIANREHIEPRKLGPAANLLWSVYLERWLKRGRPADSSESDTPRVDFRYGLDFDEAMALSIPLIQTRPKTETGKKEARQALELILTSFGVEQRLSRRDGRGSEEDLENIRKLFSAGAELLGKGRVARLVLDWSNSISDHEKPWERQNGRSLLAAYRVIDALQKDLGEPSLQAAELEIFKKSNATNKISLEQVAKNDLDSAELYVRGDLNSFQVDYLQPFFERHRETILKEVGLTEGKFLPEKLNPFFLMYFLKSEHSNLSPRELLKVYLATLTAIADHRGWEQITGDSWIDRFSEDDKIASVAREGLVRILKQLSNVDARNAAYRYRQIFTHAANISFYRSEMPRGYTYDHIPNPWAYILKKYPLLDRPTIERGALRLLMGVRRQNAAYKRMNAIALGEILTKMLPFFPKISIDNLPPATAFPYISDPGINRIEPGMFPMIELGPMLPPDWALIEFVRDWALTLGQMTEKEWTNSFGLSRPLQAIKDSSWACELISKDAGTIAELKKLKAILRSASYTTHGSDLFDTRWSIDRLLSECRFLPSRRENPARSAR